MTQATRDNGNSSPRSQTFWKLVIVGCALMWGLSFTVTKGMTSVTSPMWIIAIRFVPSAACMVVPLWRRMSDPANRGTVLVGAALGVMLWVAYALQVWGLAHTTASKGSFLNGIYCVIIPFVAWALGSVMPRRRNLLAAALCICGLALITLDGDLSVNTGDVSSTGCSCCVAIETYLLSVWGQGRDSAVLSASMFGVVGALSLAWALVADPLPGPDAVTPMALVTWAYLSLGCTLVAIAAMNEAFLHVNPVPGSLLSSLEAPLGTIAAITLGGEVLTGRLVAGFVLIACAVVVSEAGDMILERLRGLRGEVTA